jgi:hypothetical protein
MTEAEMSTANHKWLNKQKIILNRYKQYYKFHELANKARSSSSSSSKGGSVSSSVLFDILAQVMRV